MWFCCVATYSIRNLGDGGDYLAFKGVKNWFLLILSVLPSSIYYRNAGHQCHT
jgi:hypothetical protein